MKSNIKDKILFEFNNSNFKEAYNLAINTAQIKNNDFILKILTISSFKIQKYSDSVKFGLNLLNLIDSKNDIQILYILGTSYSILKDFDNGNKYLKQYLSIEPQNIAVQYNLGLNLFNQKKFEESKIYFSEINSKKNGYRNSELLYGIIQSEIKNYKNAINIFKKLINKKKFIIESYYNLGIVYQKIKKYELSIKFLKKSINEDNQQHQFFNSLGISYQKLFKYKEARTYYEQAIKLNNNYSKAYSNLGYLLEKNGFFEEAIKKFDIALKYNPDDREILYNKSICLLEHGNFIEGLKLYKWRQNGKYLNSDFFKLNEIQNKKIFISSDQGLGDIILQSRFVKLLADYGAQVTFQIPQSMQQLLKNLDDKINITTSQITKNNFDYSCELGDLFKIFNIDISNIPLSESYLNIDKKWIKKWQNKLNKKNFNIGIVWQGKNGEPVDEGRSFKLKNFENISNIKNIQLISLQKNYGEEQIKIFNEKNNIINFSDILDVKAKFMDSAGLMKNLDLIISSDTSIVHLAGALGVKTWLLLQKYPFWYWHVKDQYSIWYDNVKIFKQDENHNWKKLFAKIENELIKSR